MRIRKADNIYYDSERNVYYAYFNYGKREDGKGYIRKAQTFSNFKAAKKAVREFEVAQANKKIHAPRNTTLKEFSDDWIKYKDSNCEKTTIYHYTCYLKKHVNPILGDMSLEEITPKVINEFIHHKLTGTYDGKPLTKNYMRKIYDMLKQMFDRAVELKEISENPLNYIKPPKKQETNIDVYTLNQLKKLFEVSAGTRMEIVVKLAGYLGLRRGEICGLKWSSIDFEKKLLIVNNTRTRAQVIIEKAPKSLRSKRVLAIPDDLLDVLKKVKEEQEHIRKAQEIESEFEYVVCNTFGTPVSPNYVSDCFKAMIDDAHLPHTTLHGLRHSFASVANELGISIYEISTAMGHSSVAITDKIYVTLFQQSHRSTIDAVADVLK